MSVPSWSSCSLIVQRGSRRLLARWDGVEGETAGPWAGPQSCAWLPVTRPGSRGLGDSGSAGFSRVAKLESVPCWRRFLEPVTENIFITCRGWGLTKHCWQLRGNVPLPLEVARQGDPGPEEAGVSPLSPQGASTESHPELSSHSSLLA